MNDPRDFTDKQLAEKDREYQAIEDDKSLEWEGGGSPKESFYERWDSVVNEMQRRGLVTTQG